jgi:hypothetical protein
MSVSADYTFDIQTLLAESQPKSVLVIGHDGEALVSDYVQQKTFLKQPCQVRVLTNNDLLAQLEKIRRFDTGVVINVIQYMEKKIAGQLIAKLRDVHTPQFCLVVPIGSGWTGHQSTWEPNDLLGFGMSRVNRYRQDGKTTDLYKYDIATYKKTPEWLNPSNWANPQLWDKYRW